jgi:ketosteroid isomerase-like protein
MTEDANKKLMANFGKAWVKADVEGILACVTDDFEWRQATGSDGPSGRIIQGKDQLRAALAERDKSFADLSYSENKVEVFGDRIVQTFRISGKTPDGRAADWRGCDLYHVRDGKLAYKDSYWKQTRG